MSQSKVQVIQVIRNQPAPRRLATRYVREQPYEKINRQRKWQLDTISFLKWCHICHGCFVLVGIDLGVIRLRGETVSLTSRMRDTNYRNFTPKYTDNESSLGYKSVSYGMKFYCSRMVLYSVDGKELTIR